MPESKEQSVIGEFLSDNTVKDFIFYNLRMSLSDIGFSEKLIEDLISNMVAISSGDSFDVKSFGLLHKKELQDVYSVGFFRKYVPEYFERYVVPATPSCKKILDIGCGTGILASIYSSSRRFNDIVGIDINPYPEWSLFKSDSTRFEVVTEDSVWSFLEKEKPDSIVLTWTLHHMDFEEQLRYIRYIHESLPAGSRVVVLEDSYSDNLYPMNGKDKKDSFMMFAKSDRAKIMAVYDWVANRVLAQRDKVPIPFGYRTAEEWTDVFESLGFKTELISFIGFPEKRDINTPQTLMVFGI